MDEKKAYSYGEKRIIKTDFGPVSFGWVLSGSVVSWSGNNSNDLLIGRCWEGLYLYPSRKLSGSELSIEPMKVWPTSVGTSYAIPVDWNKDGIEDCIVADREGFLYFLKRRGEFPNISFELIDAFKDTEKNVYLNIPFENPNYPKLDNLGGYFDTAFFNYTFPVVYPSGTNQKIDLIIGDTSGLLWWLNDLTDGSVTPEYRGMIYRKPEDEIQTKAGKKLLEQYGSEYIKPEAKICDEKGDPFLLGDGFDAGIKYEGGNTRPVVYKNEITGSYDILVLAGTMQQKLFYLKRADTKENGKPVFKNLGEIDLEGIFDPPLVVYCHAKVIVHNTDGWNDLLIAVINKIAVFKNKKRTDTVVPEFQFSHWISGKDTPTSGNNFSEILNSPNTGKRYLLDNITFYNKFELREIKVSNRGIRISSEGILLSDQNGIFQVEGETDPQGGKDWGFNRASGWNYDNSTGEHLIVGTDKGLLYLLRKEAAPDGNDDFFYRSFGPLKDCDGSIIKVHNRTCAAGIDLNGNGYEDLIVGGASYQMGIKTDPNPGGGIYYLINKGLDKNGVPVLQPLTQLEIQGHKFIIKKNHHVQIQAIDLDNDGEKEVVIACPHDEYRGMIFKAAKGGAVRLVYTGKYLPKLSIEERLLDIDGDGQLEFIFAGGENGIGYYRKLINVSKGLSKEI